MCECNQTMGRLPYQIQTSNDPNVYAEMDVAGDIVITDEISGMPVHVESTESSETTKQSNWLPVLIITGITLFALKRMK